MVQAVGLTKLRNLLPSWIDLGFVRGVLGDPLALALMTNGEAQIMVGFLPKTTNLVLARLRYLSRFNEGAPRALRDYVLTETDGRRKQELADLHFLSEVDGSPSSPKLRKA